MSRVVIFRPIVPYDSNVSSRQGDLAVGIAVGIKMDPNYIIVNIILPTPIEHVVIYKPCLTYTSLTLADLATITSLDEFQQTYPEYFI